MRYKIWGSRQFQFDRYCEEQGASRAEYLKPYFERKIKPDSPYHGLAKLAKAGYASLIISFNIDNLLEDAFEAAGIREGTGYQAIDAAVYRPEAVADMVDAPGGAPIRLLKLHGGHRSGFNLMTSLEIAEYGDRIGQLVERCSKRSAVVCGYSFFHLKRPQFV